MGSKPGTVSYRRVLLQFYLSAYLFEGFLESLSGCLVKTFLHGRGSSVNDVLSLFQAQTGLLLNGLNDLEFLCTSALEYNVERGLLLAAAAGSMPYSSLRT